MCYIIMNHDIELSLFGDNLAIKVTSEMKIVRICVQDRRERMTPDVITEAINKCIAKCDILPNGQVYSFGIKTIDWVMGVG